MAAKLEDLDVNGIVRLLENWEMKEFVGFVKEKQINGRKILEVTEGILKLWRPNVDAKKFITFTQDLKTDPQKFINSSKNNDVITIKETNLCSESQYQTVSVRKISQQESNSFSTVEEILKKITAPKSFLYRNHQKKLERSSYLPMDAGTAKKPKKFFRLSSYEYPIFDFKSRSSKTEAFADRGYYSVKTDNKFYIQKTSKSTESRLKYKSLGTPEELAEKLPEDHLYEDLCYNDIPDSKIKEHNLTQIGPVKPCIVKIQELFQSFRLPFFRRSEAIEKDLNVNKDTVTEKESNIYENSSNDMYDSIHLAKDTDLAEKDKVSDTNKNEDIEINAHNLYL